MTIVADFPCPGADGRIHPTASLRLFASAALPEGKVRITFERRDGFDRGRQGPKEGCMYKRIILAVDLAESVSTPKGLPQALELSKAGGGELRLVNVQAVIPATFMEYVPVDFDEEQEKRAKAELGAILAGVDLPAERKSAATRAGGIYHELLEEASEWRADLIVVGSHRPVMSDYLLGSNATTIVRHAQCSVLVVRE
jgi:nucleotide-binding universal stress UspA family protein